jgi:hypothetical protein
MKTAEEIYKQLCSNGTDRENVQLLETWGKHIVELCEDEVTTWDDVEYEDPGPLVEKLKKDVRRIKKLI